MQHGNISNEPYGEEAQRVRARVAAEALTAEPVSERKRDKTKGLQLSRGEEWILLVDDDPLLMDVCTQMLEHLGYRVMSADCGEEALELFRAHAGLFDMVITDMNMPGINGDQLTRELLAIRPDLPVLLCTGYSESMCASRARALGAAAFRLKPMPIAEMARCIRSLIDQVN